MFVRDTTRRVAWLCRYFGGVAVLTLGAVAAWLLGSAPPATAASPLNNPTWSTSRSTVGAAGASYTYTFKNTGAATTLDSVTMTVPVGTGGSPTAGTVTPPAVAAGGTVTLSGTTLRYSFTPSLIKNGKPVSIQINGLTNTAVAGSYTSAIATVSSGSAVSSGTTPAVTFTAGALVNPAWSASSTATGASGASYTYSFTTGTTSLLSSVTMTVPPGTAGSPSVGAVTPSGLATGASVALSGTTLTYSFTLTSISAGTAVSIQINGLTNTATIGTYTSALTTQSDTGIVDAGTTPGITFTGILTLTSPSTLTWAATLNGTNQSVVDTVPAHQQLTVADTTASGAGWHVTVAATTLTNGSHTLANTGTLSLTGSVTSPTGTTAPTAGCAPTTTCTLPTDATAYPVAITTAATAPTAFTIYDTAATTGLGQIVIGGSAAANPIGWWVKIPANAFPGSYSSTVTLAVVSTP
jgi:hypothetical protein